MQEQDLLDVPRGRHRGGEPAKRGLDQGRVERRLAEDPLGGDHPQHQIHLDPDQPLGAAPQNEQVLAVLRVHSSAHLRRRKASLGLLRLPRQGTEHPPGAGDQPEEDADALHQPLRDQQQQSEGRGERRHRRRTHHLHEGGEEEGVLQLAVRRQGGDEGGWGGLSKQ